MTILSDSYATGFILDEATYYSTPGSGSGTWTNQVAWAENWTHGSTDPAATTLSGVSAMPALSFTNSVNQIITGKWRFGAECTIIVIGECSNLAGASRYLIGGTNTGSNSWTLYTTTGSKISFSFNTFGQTVTTTNSVSINTPFIASCSFSPENSTAYVQVNDSAAVTATISSLHTIGFNSWYAGIGRHRSSYADATKIARVEIYSRALHYRDNTNLQARISSFKTTLGI